MNNYIKIELKNEIIQYVENRKRGIKWNKFPYTNVLQDIFNDYEASSKELFLRLKYDILEKPKCKICGKPCKFSPYNDQVYAQICDNKQCTIQLRHIKSKQTKLERYGDENYVNPDKAKQTKLERYGDENYVNPDKAKQTKLERYGDENYVNADKAKQTCLIKYGVENVFANNEIQEKIKNTIFSKYGVKYIGQSVQIQNKIKQTKLERYGDENYTNTSKAIQTCLDKYGVKNWGMSVQAIEKRKLTCMERYGVDHNWKIPEEHDLTHTIEANDKKRKTCMKNYGVEYPSQSPIIKKKIKESLRKTMN